MGFATQYSAANVERACHVSTCCMRQNLKAKNCMRAKHSLNRLYVATHAFGTDESVCVHHPFESFHRQLFESIFFFKSTTTLTITLAIARSLGQCDQDCSCETLRAIDEVVVDVIQVMMRPIWNLTMTMSSIMLRRSSQSCRSGSSISTKPFPSLRDEIGISAHCALFLDLVKQHCTNVRSNTDVQE